MLLPYAAYSVISFLYWWLVERRFSGNALPPGEAAMQILLVQGSDDYLPHNPALWFLPALFLTEVLHRLIGRWPLRWLWVIGLAFIGWYAGTVQGMRLPWCLDVSLAALVFYEAGYVLRGSGSIARYTETVPVPGRLVMLGACGAFAFYLSQYNAVVDLSLRMYGRIAALWVPVALLGIAAVCLLADVWRLGLWQHLGRRSLWLLGLHIPVKRALLGLAVKLSGWRMEDIKSSAGASFLLAALAIGILLGAYELFSWLRATAYRPRR